MMEDDNDGWGEEYPPGFERRLRRMDVSCSLLEEMFSHGFGATKPTDPIEEMRIVDAMFDRDHAIISLILRSAEFDIVPEGAEPPLWAPGFKRLGGL